jgi:hypothetical protein
MMGQATERNEYMKTISFDLDGVLAVWPFNLHPGVSGRTRYVPPLPDDFEGRYRKLPPSAWGVRFVLEWLRFSWRMPDPQTAELLGELMERRRIVITTGRSAAGRPVLQGWLRRYGLERFIDDVHMSPGGLSTRQHKLASLRRSGIDEHVDDDPVAVRYLHEHGIGRLYFRAWPNTEAASLPASAVRVGALRELLEAVD